MAFHALIAVPLLDERPGGPSGRSGACRARAAQDPAAHGSSTYEPQRMWYPHVNGHRPSPGTASLGPGPTCLARDQAAPFGPGAAPGVFLALVMPRRGTLAGQP